MWEIEDAYEQYDDLAPCQPSAVQRQCGTEPLPRAPRSDDREIRTRLEELYMVVGSEAVEEVLGIFLRGWSGDLGRAVVQQDVEALRWGLMRLRGDAGLLGIPSVVSICDSILSRGRDGSFPEVLDGLADLGREFNRIRDAVHAWRAARFAGRVEAGPRLPYPPWSA